VRFGQPFAIPGDAGSPTDATDKRGSNGAHRSGKGHG
jgi:hypothetical protein